MSTHLINLGELTNKVENGNLTEFPQDILFYRFTGLMDVRNGFLTQHILNYDEMEKIMASENIKLRQIGRKLAFTLDDAFKPG